MNFTTRGALALFAALTASGCAARGAARNRPAMPPSPPPPGGYVFLANTSPADFDDLYEVSPANPRFEGLFDLPVPAPDGRGSDSILESRPKPNGTLDDPENHLAFEAEWVLLFEHPLPADKPPESIGQLRAGFGVLAEGKWIHALLDRADPARSPWSPASARNNLMPSGVVAEKPSEDGGSEPFFGYKTLDRWCEILDVEGPQRRALDGLTAVVSHPGRRRLFGFDPPWARVRNVELRASFRDTRRNLFETERRLNVKDLAAAVCEFYHKRYNRAERESLRVAGINLGAHGANAAAVNGRFRRAAGFARALAWPDPRNFRTRVKRGVAASILSGGPRATDPAKVQISIERED